jgi:hypothetical protein
LLYIFYHIPTIVPTAPPITAPGTDPAAPPIPTPVAAQPIVEFINIGFIFNNKHCFG